MYNMMWIVCESVLKYLCISATCVYVANTWKNTYECTSYIWASELVQLGRATVYCISFYTILKTINIYL